MEIEKTPAGQVLTEAQKHTLDRIFTGLAEVSLDLLRVRLSDQYEQNALVTILNQVTEASTVLRGYLEGNQDDTRRIDQLIEAEMKVQIERNIRREAIKEEARKAGRPEPIFFG